nr:rod shape-determining protein MreD [Sphingomicrobium sediminis]
MAKSKRRQRHESPFEQGPRRFASHLPWVSILVASSLAILPFMSMRGWWPDFGLLMLLGWRMQRSDAFPNWYAIPLGLANDLLTGHPIGLSVVTYNFALLMIDIIDARRMWNYWWSEWLVAALLVTFAELLQWFVAYVQDAAIPIKALIPPVIIMIFFVPIALAIASALDRYRLRQRRGAKP